jgi:hypothetical protein
MDEAPTINIQRYLDALPGDQEHSPYLLFVSRDVGLRAGRLRRLRHGGGLRRLAELHAMYRVTRSTVNRSGTVLSRRS